jgi:predicted nucleic acid-binding protein
MDKKKLQALMFAFLGIFFIINGTRLYLIEGDCVGNLENFWDALIVATMEENSIDTIITENEKDFKKVKWIKTINPFKKAE